MDSKLLIASFADYAKQRNIDRPTTMRILEDVFRAMIRKQFNTDDNFAVTINMDAGDLEIYRNRTVVDDDSEDIWEDDTITFTEAIKIVDDIEIGEEVSEAVYLEDFGRRLVQIAGQTLKQKINDLAKEHLFDAYKNRVGEIISAEVYQITSRDTLLADADNNELVMPRSNQIPRERFNKGEVVRGVVDRVEMNNGVPRIIISRTSPVFLERLFEQEVPEVEDGLIGIKKIVREPGERAKVAVESFDDRIDPVGACVGQKGSRIHAIVRELQNENIDVINYTSNTELFIIRSLSPARITSVKIDYDTNKVSVFLKPDQVSLAIGKHGQNIKLAGKLVGMEIDVFRDSEGAVDEDDIDLQEFDDEIEEWKIKELKRIGLDTARSVLANTKTDLLRRTELEEEDIEEIFEILSQEFKSVQDAAEQNAEAASDDVSEDEDTESLDVAEDVADQDLEAGDSDMSDTETGLGADVTEENKAVEVNKAATTEDSKEDQPKAE